jgi:cytochrome P450
MQKSKYIDDLEMSTMIFSLQGEVPWVYNIIRLLAPAFIAKCDTALQNVINAGLSATSRAKKASLGRHNIINGLIEASRAEGATLRDSSLGAQASALILAGSGTTAVTLTYAVWAILTHSTVRKRLEDEMRDLPDDYDDTALEKLPFLNAVITETLRLYGSAPGALPRVLPSKGFEIRDMYIPPGTVMTTQAYTMHRDPAIFPDPER